MSDTQINECLPFTDAFFLYLEQPGAPLNVAAISDFEGVIPLAPCMEYVNSKLPLIPRLLQRVVIPPLNIGPPTFRYDPHFNIRNHVREIKLKHGTDVEWKSAVSEILSTHLDRSRPLWDFTLIQGLKGERTGAILRLHHCIVDGVAGVGLLNVLLDPTPVIPKLNRKKTSVPAPPPPEPGTVLLDTLISACFSTGQAFLTVHSELLRMAQQASHPCGNGSQADQIHEAVRPLASIAPLGDLARLISELARPTQRLPFNVLCRGPQKFDWTEISMAEIAAVKKVCDATVNEVVLTVVGTALRRYAELHKVKLKGRKLRIVVPVNIRSDGQSGHAGNQITFLPVDIPLNGRDPLKFLSLVQKRVKFSRTAHAAELIGLAGMLIGATPSPIQSLTGSVLSQMPISLCNSICTNVPGPKIPLYLLGHRLLSTYPCVPIGGEMGMNCAVMSYDGKLFVAFTGDAQAIPDLSTLPEFFTQSFAEIRDAALARAPKSERPRKTVKVAIGKSRENPIAAHADVSGGSPASHETNRFGRDAIPGENRTEVVVN